MKKKGYTGKRYVISTQELCDLYNSGMSLIDIEKATGVTIWAIRGRFIRIGFSLRPRIEGIRLAFSKGHHFKGRRGEKCAAWRGGRVMQRGYVLIYAPDHPRAQNGKYVFEHILVWEKIHGYPLPIGDVIHHLNGVKNDNRPENLVALSTRKHTLVFKEKEKRILMLEEKINELQKNIHRNSEG